MKKKYFIIPFIIWTIVFTLLPLVIIFFYSLDGSGQVGQLSFKLTPGHYSKFFEPMYLGVFLRTAKLALFSTIICLLIGYPMAYIISQKGVRMQGLLVMFVLLPQWTNFLLRTYAWMNVLRDKGVLNSLLINLGIISEPIKFLYTEGAIMMGMVYNFLPFMVLPIYSVLMKLDSRYIEAARDLGANSITVFSKVIFPLSIPGVVSGIIMVFMPAMSTFVISDLLGGGHFMLMGGLIQNQFLAARNWQFGSAVSMVLIVIILISMYFLNKYQDNAGGENLW